MKEVDLKKLINFLKEFSYLFNFSNNEIFSMNLIEKLDINVRFCYYIKAF